MSILYLAAFNQFLFIIISSIDIAPKSLAILFSAVNKQLSLKLVITLKFSSIGAQDSFLACSMFHQNGQHDAIAIVVS
jgi:hypothetical protein